MPSQQRNCLKLVTLWLNGQQNRIYSSLVDVPSQQRNCLKLVIFVAEVHHGFDEIISNGGRAEPTKVEFESISFGAERPTEPHLILSGGRAEI